MTIEKEALLEILGRLKDILDIVELVTDASASIKKAIGKDLACISIKSPCKTFNNLLTNKPCTRSFSIQVTKFVFLNFLGFNALQEKIKGTICNNCFF